MKAMFVIRKVVVEELTTAYLLSLQRRDSQIALWHLVEATVLFAGKCQTSESLKKRDISLLWSQTH